MQKKIIALAVAGLVSGAAFAQSNVVVYGVVDMNYTYAKAGDAKFSGMENGGLNGGRIGFKGEEALGNGLKAIYTVEMGLDPDVNSAFNQTRQSFVGLSGNFGTISAGRQYAPSGMFLGATSSNDITSVNPVNMQLGNAFDTMETGGGSRWNNSIAYHSNKMAGFDVRAVYSFGENVRDSYSDASTDASKFGIGARYANGPLFLTAIYQTVLDNNGTTPAGAEMDTDGNKSWAVGGSYDFKVAKLFANYIYEKDQAPADDIKKKLWSLGVAVPVTKAGTIKAEYMQFKGEQAGDSAKAKGFGIGYEHDLSKRTRLYGYVSRVNNDDGMAWSYKTVSAYADGENATAFQVGLRHAF